MKGDGKLAIKDILAERCLNALAVLPPPMNDDQMMSTQTVQKRKISYIPDIYITIVAEAALGSATELR